MTSTINMASPAHCYYCFEVIAAKIEGYEDVRIELQPLLDLYEQWQKELEGETGTESTAGQSADRFGERFNVSVGQLQLPSISRLRDTTPFPGTSDVSTPSTMSVNSSHTHLNSAISLSDSSSRGPLKEEKEQLYPMFVTWDTISRSGNKSLRGCIGTFEAVPPEHGLKTYAIASAFEDTRFKKIVMDDVPRLACSLTLLANFQECAGPMDWDLGEHGIRIKFTHKQRRYNATYLPHVATEQGWTQEETLVSLMHKAGWGSYSHRSSRGSDRPWEDVRDFKVTRYTGLKASASYSEWQEWRTWAMQKQPELWS